MIITHLVGFGKAYSWGMDIMGSMIYLKLGNWEVDWGKNSGYADHSALFQINDIKQIPYYYVDIDSGEPIVEKKEGYSRKFSRIKKRLDLLGYSIDSIRRLYEVDRGESILQNIMQDFMSIQQ